MGGGGGGASVRLDCFMWGACSCCKKTHLIMIWFGEEVSSKEKERKKKKRGEGGGGEKNRGSAAVSLDCFMCGCCCTEKPSNYYVVW